MFTQDFFTKDFFFFQATIIDQNDGDKVSVGIDAWLLIF
jgi:hypothetical protein